MTSPNEEKLDRVIEALGQVGVNLETLRVTLSSLVRIADDHEKRIRSIERWHNSLTPLLSAITFTLGAIVTATLQSLL